MEKLLSVVVVWLIWAVPCALFPLALVVPVLASVLIVMSGATDEWREDQNSNQ